MALTAAPEDQALLLDLQELDTRLQRLARQAQQLPEHAHLAALTEQHSAGEQRRATQQDTVEDGQAELRRTEADVEVVDTRIARDSERLAASTSVKDVAALEQELQALATRKSDLEDIELAVMESLEEKEALLARLDQEQRETLTAIEATQQSRDAALASIESEVEHARANRATVADKVPADLLALYEKQRERYGVGASHLRGGVSSASGVTLTASDMNDIRNAAAETVILCPDSNAILVRTTESGL